MIGLIRLSERRAVFVSAVTHELRTPLTTFNMYTEMLPSGLVPKGREMAYVDILKNEAGRLTHLVDNVLSYARVERKFGLPPAGKIPVTDLASAVIARISPAGRRGHGLPALRGSGAASGGRDCGHDRRGADRVQSGGQRRQIRMF